MVSNKGGHTGTKTKTKATGLPTNWKKLKENVIRAGASTHIPSAAPSRSSSSVSQRSAHSELDDDENDESFRQGGAFDEDEAEDVVAAAREAKSHISIQHGRTIGDRGQGGRKKNQVCMLAEP